jgi:hypothetical protein
MALWWGVHVLGVLILTFMMPGKPNFLPTTYYDGQPLATANNATPRVVVTVICRATAVT